MTPVEETWQPIADWPEYSISSHGRIRSEYRVVMRRNGCPYTVAERILRPHRHGAGDGTLSVAFSRPGEPGCRVFIRRLMQDLRKEEQ